jgi:NADH-quinone oxidoreductase subunit G
MSDIEIEIDGKKCQAKPNAMVIQVADEAGIYIPRFCYHKHLSIAANCRMCLVEVEKSPKALPACATPVMPGMKVFTRSSKALAAQKAVMEFLLINHPLDCPICDQGGACELQDLSMGFGSGDSFYNEGKRAVEDKDIGPLIQTTMTRCIHCTRCVRFGAEIAGMRELGATGRGEHMEIGTYIEHAMKSEVSGNVIDICPVGALTSKPFRFKARPWELQQFPTISAHDCVGSNLYAHTRNGTVMRVVPHENASVNQTWISDRDRFSYEGLYHADRLKNPMIKTDGVWNEVEWPVALEAAVKGLQKVLEKDSAQQIAALASPNSTLEEFYLLQKLMRTLGSNNIDHRLRQSDFADQNNLAAYPTLDIPVTEIQACDVIYLIGSNVQKEQPRVGLQVRKASLQAAKVIALNPIDYDFNFNVAHKQIVSPAEIVSCLAGVTKALLTSTQNDFSADQLSVFANISVDADHAGIAATLLSGKKVCVLLGAGALNHAQASVIRTLAKHIAQLTNAHLGLLTDGANAAGAWIAGAVPHRESGCHDSSAQGLNAKTAWEKQCKAYVLLNVEPDLDCANAVLANQALAAADCVVSLSLYKNAALLEHADVILPIAAFTESAGTFVNMSGEWQTYSGVANAFESSRPAWKILRVLGNLLHCAGFDYTSPQEVLTEIKTIHENATPLVLTDFALHAYHLTPADKTTLYRVGNIPIYSTDSLVRHAHALQMAQPVLEGNVSEVRVNAKLAAQLQKLDGDRVKVKQDQNTLSLPLKIDHRMADGAVYVAGGIVETSGLGDLFGEIRFLA